MRKNRLIATALLSAAALTLSACSSGGDSKDKPTAEVSADQETKAATVLDTPFKKPDMVLTDTDGKEFDLIERTEGKPTLLYFGYTNCPDVCPLTMSNLALALKDVPADVRKKLQVIMVSSDPERDTPKELGKWLKGQDPSFIGLTGDFPTIQAGARTLGISIDEPVKEKDGSITSTHGKQVMAFSPKTDEGYVFYNGETTSAEDYAKDLPKLAEGAKP
ncbi:SCO family protein [Streptomyces triticagri]|uniref:SCO family protein n=1 Tax=Streptomyces triticagri TaxID=2293568 RepID=A0A372LYT5_9ACTN|nr:SCO family protein [Streptomyces triticagri]RFU83207.1 SCO family protein [Streptomyces triticagri]